MTTLSIPYPEELAAALPPDAPRYIALMAALKLFELGQLSTGHAAKLAGVSRPEFLELCGRYRVSVFNHAPDELERELRSDLETLRQALP